MIESPPDVTYAIWCMDDKGTSVLVGKTHYESAAELMVKNHASKTCYAYAILWSPTPTYAFGSLGGQPLNTKDVRRVLQTFLQTR